MLFSASVRRFIWTLLRAFAFVTFLVMTACTERTLEIGFLSVSRESTEFKINNESNSGVISADVFGNIPLNITCPKDVLSIEIDLGEGFHDIASSGSVGAVTCSTSGTANVSFPVGLAVTASHAVEGDVLLNTTIKWFVKNPENASSPLTYTRSLKTLFPVPTLTLVTPANIFTGNALNYEVNGVCKANLPVQTDFIVFAPEIDCDDGNFSFTGDMNALPEGTSVFNFKHRAALGNYSNYNYQVVKDTVRPTVTFTGKGWISQNGTSVYEVEAQFSEVVTGFTVNDINVSNGTAVNLVGALANYTFYIVPTSNGAIEVVLPENVYDVAGNSNEESLPFSVVFSSNQPTVTLSSASQAILNSYFIVDVSFSEAVSGFDISDIAVNGAGLSNFVGSGASYSFKVTPTVDGVVQISIPANVALNSTSIGNLASQPLVRTYDSVAPSVSLTLNSATNSAVWNLTAQFSENVTGLDAADITVTNGTASGLSGTGSTYTFQVTPSSAGTVTVNITAGAANDGAGNASQAATFSDTYAVPAPTISAISPTSGPAAGGTVLTIDGTNLHSGGTVRIGSVFCVNVQVINSTKITCVTGASSVVSAGVTFTNINGTITSSSTYSYTANTYIAVDAGAYHTCAVVDNGVARCWGDNSSGSLGNGTTTKSNVPVSVNTTLRFQKVSAGYYFTCGLTQGGAVYCWGANDFYQLGNSGTVNSLTPTAISSGVTFMDLEVGANHACAISVSNALYCWGYNNYGQAGAAGMTSVPTPQIVDAGVSYATVSVGFDHTCGVTSSATIKCWGNNANGQLGLNNATSWTSVPMAIFGGESYHSVAAGNAFACGITTGYILKCWGLNNKGQIGTGTAGGIDVLTPTTVSSVQPAHSVAAGSDSVCAVTSTSLYCWGGNLSGQVGNGSTSTSQPSPMAISSSAVASTVGGAFACSLSATGSIKCWGSNSDGQIGVGSVTSMYSAPVSIAN